ncbi:cation:proton antiporter [Candidatus Woesearchaeota archaeon]|nr:cation:proton antiporter [Candidatus Woesearchaeota archaeon]
MSNLITDIGFIVIIATLCAAFARWLRQPLILSYILAGVIIGPYGLKLVSDYSTISIASELGIAFLLFIVGLELDINKLKNLGGISLFAGIGQVVLTFLAGYYFTQWVGFTALHSVYLSIALTLSSTILVVKLYEDKEQLDTLHGRVALGILLVQDFLAIISMAMLSTETAAFSLPVVLVAILKGLGFFIVALLIGQYLLPPVFKFAAESHELLFIASVAWCFLFAMIAVWLELSVAIGAFLAGISLASLPYSFDIINKTRSLRDFFATIFFVSLGMQIVFPAIINHLPIIFLLSAFVLIGNPLIVMIVMSLFGFKAITSFLTSIAIAQVSEFSLVYLMFATNLGLVPESFISIMAAIAIITFTISSYMIIHGERIYAIMQKFLKLFEKISLVKREFSYLPDAKESYDIIIFGCNRIGNSILKKAQKLGRSVLVIDYHPERVQHLMKQKIPCMYGDISDPSLLSKISFKETKIIISTVPDERVNLLITKKVRQTNKKTLKFVTADHNNHAVMLYDAGADYVLMPHHLGGEYAASLLEDVLPNKKKLQKIKKEHTNELLRGQ